MGLPEPVWALIGVAAVKPSRGGYAIELVDPAKPDDAQLRAYLPDSVIAALRQASGRALLATHLVGLSAVMRLALDVHPRWGLSAKVTALAPGLEVSLSARALETSRARLRAEGLLERQRGRPVPRDVTRLAIIHPPEAAGWTDVQSELVRWAEAGLLAFRSLPVCFEGLGASKDLASAIDRATAPIDGHGPDLVMLVRGGGARAGLAPLDDEALARAIACCPVPVVTGLGHKQDSTLADDVARFPTDTPSKALARVRDLMAMPARRARADHAAVAAALSVRLDRAALGLSSLERHVTADVSRQALAVSETLERTWAAVRAAVEAGRERLARQDDGLERLAADVAHASPALVAATASALDTMMEAVRAGARRGGAGAPDGAHHVAAASARAEALVASVEADLALLRRAVPVAARAIADKSAAGGASLLESIRRLGRDGSIRADGGSRHLAVVEAAIAAIHQVQDAATERLRQGIEAAIVRRIEAAATDLDRISAALDAADPAAILDLGFALAMDRSDRPITSAAAARAASTFALHFNDGTVVVQLVKPNPKSGDKP